MSPEKEKTIGKPKLNRTQLRGHGIDFIEKVSDIDELDNWLQPIGRTITRLQERIPKASRKIFNKELKRFYLRGQDRDDARTEDWCLMPAKNSDDLQRENHTISAAEGHPLELASYGEASKAIHYCRSRNENESKWTQVLLEHVFWDFYKVNRGSSSSPYE